VGKSSVALQLKRIAEGDDRLVKMLYLQKFLPKKGFDFIVHYYKSDTFIKTTVDLFKRILFGDDKNPSLFTLTKAGDRRLDEFKRVVSLGGEFGAFGLKLAPAGQEEKTYKQYISDDLIQQFRHLLGTIQKDNNNRSGLLLIVDEFDRIADKDGFASIVKACSSDFVKFGVVGIATTVTELIRDHSSIGRQIDTVPVPLMPKEELSQILRRAEFIVDEAITFESDASQAIAQRSEGFPFFTHLMGREAMLLAFERESPKVTSGDIEVLSARISDGFLRCIYEDMYHAAVKNSPQRELLLKIFAEHHQDEIGTEEVYALAREMDVTNPSQLMKQFTTPDSPDAAPSW